MSEKTVFISYRRDAAGKGFARSLAQALKHEGYDVFLDVDSIDAGQWAEQISTQVPERAHFLLMLTPGALDRCEDEADWVRREYESAVRHGRNIVPVREESVDLAEARQACPESMASVFDWKVAAVRHGSFERDIEDLIQRYIPPHKAPRPAAALTFDRPVLAELRHNLAILLFDPNEKKYVSLPWSPPSSNDNDSKATVGLVRGWKKIHRIAEKLYRSFSTIHIELLGVGLAPNRLQRVEGVLDVMEGEIRNSCSELDLLPEPLKSAQSIRSLLYLHLMPNAIRQDLTSDVASDQFLSLSTTLVERATEWSYHALHLADLIIERYLEQDADRGEQE